MTDDQRAPLLDKKNTTVARLGSIGLSYGLYRLLELEGSAIWAGLAGLGLLMILYGYVTLYSTRPADRSEMLRIGQTILGVGLLALGLLKTLT